MVDAAFSHHISVSWKQANPLGLRTEKKESKEEFFE